MTPAQARRIGKAVALLGSPVDGEVVAAARAIGRALDAAGMGWSDLAALVGAAAARGAPSGFTFAGQAPRTARKLMAHLARQPGTSPADRARLDLLRARLFAPLGARGPRPGLSAAEVEWLDALWRAAHGGVPR